MHARAPGWARSVLILVVLLPLLTSVVVRTFAWIVILGRQGIVNTALLALGLIDRRCGCSTPRAAWSWRWRRCRCR